MAAGSLQHVKQSFATVLLTIAALDSVRPMVAGHSPGEDCAKAFNRVSLKARLNKGGLLAHSQACSATKETCDKARRNKTRNREGPKQQGSSDVVATQTQHLVSASRAVSQKSAVCRKEPGEQPARGLQRICREEGRSHRLPKVPGPPLRLLS